MVLIKELVTSEDIQNIEDRETILLNPLRERADGTSDRRRRGCQPHLLVRKGKDGRGKLLRGHKDDGSKDGLHQG